MNYSVYVGECVKNWDLASLNNYCYDKYSNSTIPILNIFMIPNLIDVRKQKMVNGL